MTEIAQPPAEANNKKKKAFAVFGTVVALGLILGLVYRQYSKTHVSTDDAFIEGSIHVISSRVPGTVKAVRVSHNQPVKAGDALVEIDPDMFGRRVSEAEAGRDVEAGRLEEIVAALETQKAKVGAARAALGKAEAGKSEAEAALAAREAEIRAKEALRTQAAADLKRAEDLLKKEVISKERNEKARTQFDAADAQYGAAIELARQSRSSVKAQEQAVAQARAVLSAEEAALRQGAAAYESQRILIRRREAQAGIERLQLSYTVINAPADGFVTRKAVEVGNQVQAGQPLMSVVSLDNAYIVANYKEIALYLIKPGMKAKIKLDAYPDLTFDGRVDSIMAGTGSAFTLFPPENASGNYVKVVQRVPVKIVFDKPGEVVPYLRVGMSVVPTILTGE